MPSFSIIEALPLKIKILKMHNEQEEKLNSKYLPTMNHCLS